MMHGQKNTKSCWY